MRIRSALLLAALACASPQATMPARPSIAAGREDFVTYCASCHGLGGAGDGPIAPYMAPRPADLRKIAAKRSGVFPRAEIEEWIDGRRVIASHGTRDMPIWGAAFRAETEDDELAELRVRNRIVQLVDYLETIQQQ